MTALPAGLVATPLTPADAHAVSDKRVAFHVIGRAFSEWPEHDSRPFDDWKAVELGRPGFAPDLLGLATRGDEVVGRSW